VIETERLWLRPLALGDLDEMATLLADAEALRLWGEPLDREGARAWIVRNMARYAAHGFGRCAVVWRETGELVGDCRLDFGSPPASAASAATGLTRTKSPPQPVYASSIVDLLEIEQRLSELVAATPPPFRRMMLFARGSEADER
jgi:Acetyltransferase (GNAT) domain